MCICMCLWTYIHTHTYRDVVLCECIIISGWECGFERSQRAWHFLQEERDGEQVTARTFHRIIKHY